MTLNKEFLAEQVIQTRILMEQLEKESLDEVLKNVPQEKTLNELIGDGLKKQQISMEEMAGRAVISRATGYKITQNKMRPGKDVLIRIAFALKFTPEETQELLMNGNCGLLSVTRERDVIILYGLKNKLSLEEIDELLMERGFQPLVPTDK